MQHVPTIVAFDGDVDPGLEQRQATARGRRPPITDRIAPGDLGAEAAAHAVLRMVGDHPGQMGRLRAARILGGFSVPHRDEQDAARLAGYSIELDWPLRELTRLVDALISGRLVAQTPGPRPVLVLTRAGFRALEALEAAPGLRRGAT
jgi:hypothetical protein